jgi:hypothetical protein
VRCSQSDMSALLASSATSFPAVVVVVIIIAVRVQARDVEEVGIGHLTLAACACAKVEVERWTAGSAVVIPASVVGCVARF